MATKKKKKEQNQPVDMPATEAQLAQFNRNYANDESVVARFMEYVSDKMTNARNNRQLVEDQWVQDIRLWSCVLDDLGYVGRSNVFVPELHQQIESGVEKALATTFPNLDTIKAVGLHGTTQEKADKIKRAVRYELEDKNKLFLLHDEFERQKFLKGTSVYKGSFKKEFVDIFSRDKDGNVIKSSVPKNHGVNWEVVDMFRWYIYPEVANLDKYLLIFEDQFVDKSEVENNPLYVNTENIQTIPKDLRHQWSDSEQLQIVNLATAAQERPNSVFLTEMYFDFELVKGQRVPCTAVVANLTTVLSLRRNQYWDQKHPYLAERYVKRPGKIFYGFSMPDKLRSQQYQINDTTNHTMDSLNYTLNPITVIDPAEAGDIGSMKHHPGAKWLGSKNGITPLQYPDLTVGGLRAIQEIRGQIAQFSDNSPPIAPQLQGKSRSATQSTIVAAAISQKQRVQTQAEELNVLVPMCEKTRCYLEQFMDKEWMIKYQGPDNGQWLVEEVRPLDLIGEVAFIWNGSMQQEKTALRAQQLLGFQQQVLQMEAMKPGTIDMPTFTKKIAKEAFQLEDMEDIFLELKEKKTVSPSVENIAIEQGQRVPVHTGDDDQYHLRIHDELDLDGLSESALVALAEHKRMHEEQIAAKEEIKNMKARLEALKTMQEGGPGPQEDGREGPAVPSPMEGNRGQVATSMQDMFSGMKGGLS